VNVEDGALVSCNVNEEQVQMNVEVGETSIANLAIIEVDLQKTIEMIMEEENIIFALMQEEDEHVIRHVEIDVCHNPSLGLVTKARACKVSGQKGSPRVKESVRE